MDINDLESVCAVDICHNYSEAAESIASSPAVISKHIAKVEKELGLRIFERASKSRPVELTPAGQELVRALLAGTVNAIFLPIMYGPGVDYTKYGELPASDFEVTPKS